MQTGPRSSNDHRRRNDSGAAALEDGRLPEIDEARLSRLTHEIQERLSSSKTSGKVSRQNRSSGPGKKGLSSEPFKIQPRKDAQVKRKRDSHTDQKTPTTPVKTNATTHGSRGHDQLLQEILVLGGTEADLDLIRDVQSENEAEWTTFDNGPTAHRSTQQNLNKDVAQFIQGLGIAGVLPPPEDDVAEDHSLSRDNVQESTKTGRKDMTEVKSKSKAQRKSEMTQATDLVTIKETGTSEKLVFLPRPDWYTAEMPEISDQSAVKQTNNDVSRELLDQLSQYSFKLLEAENALYSSDHLSSSSSHRFLSTIMTSGTLSDKISALTLVVQESPLHTMKAFETLISLAGKKSRSQALIALAAIKDLLGPGAVLPSNRKLRAFSHQPQLLVSLKSYKGFWAPGKPLPGNLLPIHLITWAYEDWLKKMYFEVLKTLERWCNDEIEFARSKSLGFVWDLLKEKPEQEANLMRLLVNKLRDSSKRIASKASFLLLQLETSHPLMKDIIITSIQSELLLKHSQNSHAQYYAIITLNQTVLSNKEAGVADKLLDIYFGLFVIFLKQQHTLNQPNNSNQHRNTGRKAFDRNFRGHDNAKFAKQTKQDLAMDTATGKVGEELTEKIISAVLTGVNRAFPFTATDETTFQQHIDSLFKIAHSTNFNTSVQALMLIQQLLGSRQVISDRFYRTLYESLLDPRLLISSKQTLYLNLLFRALKADLNIKRIKAFVKRLCQVISLHQPPFVCGVLYLIYELEQTFPSLWTFINEGEEHEDGEEEAFRDVDEDSTDTRAKEHAALPRQHPIVTYDGRKRDPEYSQADRSCLWELIPFVTHFHPSVSLFATSLMTHKAMPAKPDLSQHTLIHFLDRFVYRNPKSTSSFRGVSIMQPLAGAPSSTTFVKPRGTREELPINMESFWKKNVEDVAPDEVFFHRYFKEVGKNKKSTKERLQKVGTEIDAIEGDEEEEGDEGEEEEEGEDAIWKALVSSRPELEGDEDEEGFSDMDGYGSDEESEERDDIQEPNEVDSGSEDGTSDHFEGLDVGEEEDLLESDEEVASEIGQGLSAVSEDKRIPSGESRKRRKLKHLPTFASIDDYAELLAGEEEE